MTKEIEEEIDAALKPGDIKTMASEPPPWAVMSDYDFRRHVVAELSKQRKLVGMPEHLLIHEHMKRLITRETVWTEMMHVAVQHGDDAERARTAAWLYRNWEASDEHWAKMEKYEREEISLIIEKGYPIENLPTRRKLSAIIAANKRH